MTEDLLSIHYRPIEGITDTSRREAVSLFPRNAPISIVHEVHFGNEPVPARDYLLEAGTPEAVIDTLFSPENTWIFPAHEEVRFEEVTPDELKESMLTIVEPVYRAAQDSLAKVNEFGYNDHGPVHIRSVVERTLDLARKAGLSEHQQKIAVAAAVGHDLGNLIDRDIHSTISPLIFAQIFPSLAANKEDWIAINRAIELHNAAMYDSLIANKQDKKGSLMHLPQEDIYAQMRKKWGSEGLVVLVADKVDVGRWRVNDKALAPTMIDQHQYSEYNLHMQTQDVVIDQPARQAQWNLVFRPFVAQSEQERFAPLSTETPDSRRAMYASEKVRKDDGSNLADMDKSIHQFATKHYSQIRAAVLGLFALESSCATVQINIQDESRPDVVRTVTFDRKNVEEQLAAWRDAA